MPRAELRHDRPRIDWPAWLALLWAGGFGWLYVRMILDLRGAAVLAWVRRALGLS